MISLTEITKFNRIDRKMQKGKSMTDGDLCFLKGCYDSWIYLIKQRTDNNTMHIDDRLRLEALQCRLDRVDGYLQARKTK